MEQLPTIHELNEYLHNGVVQVTFTKADGSTRVMNATLNKDLIPADEYAKEESVQPLEEGVMVKAKDENLFRVFDTEISQWRSFRYERIQIVNRDI